MCTVLGAFSDKIIFIVLWRHLLEDRVNFGRPPRDTAPGDRCLLAGVNTILGGNNALPSWEIIFSRLK